MVIDLLDIDIYCSVDYLLSSVEDVELLLKNIPEGFHNTIRVYHYAHRMAIYPEQREHIVENFIRVFLND